MLDKIILKGNNTEEVVRLLMVEREHRIHDAYVRKEIVNRMVGFADDHLKQGEKITARIVKKLEPLFADLPITEIAFQRGFTTANRLILKFEFDGKAAGSVHSEEVYLTRLGAEFWRDGFNKANGVIIKARREQYLAFRPGSEREIIEKGLTSQIAEINASLISLQNATTKFCEAHEGLEYAIAFDSKPQSNGSYLIPYFIRY